MSILTKVIKTIFGTKSDKDLKVLQPYVEEINKCYSQLSSLSDQEIKDKFLALKHSFHDLINKSKSEFTDQKIDSNLIDDKLYALEKEYLDDYMVEVFAIVKDVSRRLCNKKYMVMEQEI